MHFDLAVIGAGIIGATIAHEAQRRLPGMTILVVDSPAAVPTATTLSAGLVTPFCGVGLRRARSLLAYAHYAKLSKRNVLVRKVGFMFFARSRDEAGPLLFSASAVDRGIPAIEQVLGERDRCGDLWNGGHAYVVDVPRLVQSYLAPEDGTPCTALVPFAILREKLSNAVWKNQEWTLTVGNDVVSASRVIWATGAWATREFPRIKDQWTKKIVAFDLKSDVSPTPVVYLPREKAFLMPDIARAGWLLSITSNDWTCEPGTPVFTTRAEEEMARSVLSECLPGLHINTLVPRVAVDSYSGDRNPLVAPVECGDLACAIVGASGSGVRFAPALALEALNAVGLSVGP